MKYLVANWKSNKTSTQAMNWLQEMKGLALRSNELKVVVCPPATLLEQMQRGIKERSLPMELGGQDISPYPFGAYTGAIAAGMVKEWAQYVILGHSERREHFGETEMEVARKAARAEEEKLIPIVCLDVPNLGKQIQAMDQSLIEKMIVAYEPRGAIGSGEPQELNKVIEVIKRIKQLTDAETKVLYGGSVDLEEVGIFLKEEVIDGLLVGGASLEASKWRAIVERADRIVSR